MLSVVGIKEKMKALLLVILIIFPATIHAQDFTHPTTKVFTAKVSDVRLSADLLEKGKKMNELVSVKASAIIFHRPLKISDVRKAISYNQPAIDTFIRYIKACIDGSPAALSSFWVKPERKEIMAMLSDPEALKRTHEQFTEDPGVTIIGLLFNGQQTTILIRGVFALPEYITTVSLVHTGGGTFLTNKPHNDLDLAIIEASLNNVKGIQSLAGSSPAGKTAFTKQGK